MSRRVLFVDDEPKLLEGLQRMLRPMRREWDMHFVLGGAAALEMMDREPFHVLVSDMRMPEMDGAALLAEVRRRHPLTVRIVLTGQCSRDALLQLMSTAHRVLTKPCDAEMIKTAVQRACSLQELLRSERLAAIVGSLGTVPSPPNLYTQIVEELQRPEPSLEVLANTMTRDVGMTAKLLQMANSPLLGLRGPITSLERAVFVLGTETVKTLVLAAGVFSRYDAAAMAPFSLDTLWDHSRRVGELARRIASEEEVDKRIVVDATLGGLLHDVGRLVLAAQVSEGYKQVMELMLCQGLPLAEAEQQVLGATHAEVGAYLLGLWGLPEPLVEAVAWHHTPSRCPGQTFSALTAVHVAEVIYNEDADAADMEYFERLGLTRRLAAWTEAANDPRRSGDDP